MDEFLKDDDYQVDGQYSIYDIFEEQQPSSSIIAVSRIFAKAIKHMSTYEWKAFVSALTMIKWKEKNRHIVVFDKESLAERIGLNTDSNHLNRDLKEKLGNLTNDSFIAFDKNDEEGGWVNGNFISVVDCSKRGLIAIHFTPYYMPLFQQLTVENNYITLWADDIFKLSNENAILFYEELRLHTDVKKKTTTMQLSTRKLKELFKMPKTGKGSYTRANGKFNRPEWEKYVLDVVCEDMMKCSMITLCIGENGRLYRKIKNDNGRVLGYEFEWSYSKYPRVATANEVQELNQDPKDLKMLKDIKKGKKKPDKVAKKNNFNNFPQNEYNFAELEDLLVDN